MYIYKHKDTHISSAKTLLRITLNTGTSKISIKRYGIESRIKTAILEIKRILLTIIHVVTLGILWRKIKMNEFKILNPISQPRKTK